MRKSLFLLLGLGLILSSCGPDHKSVPQTPAEEVATSWYAGVGQFNGNLDFGNLNSAVAKLLTLSIKNVGDRTLTGPPTVSGQGFSLAYSNCTSLVVGKTCSVKVTFDPRGLNNQTYTGTISLDGSQADMSAAINIPVAVDELQVKIGDIPVGENGVDFGIVKYNQNVMKTLSITNSGRNKGPYNVSKSGTAFTISYDNCSNRELPLKSSCSIKVVLSGAGKTGVVTGGLMMGNLDILLKATVKNLAEVSAENSDIKLVVNNTARPVGPVDLGTWNVGQAQNLNVYLKNQGSESGIVQQVSVDPSIQSIFNACNEGSVLSPNDKCLMKLVTIPQSKGLFNASVSVQGNTYNLQSVVRAPGDKIYCAMSHSDDSYITWNGLEYSQCIIESCLNTHHLINNQCEPNIIDCDVNNGTGQQTWTGSEYATCQVTNCESNFHNFNNVCDPDSITCPIANGSGLISWNVESLTYGSCLVNSCSTNYSIVGNGCVADHRSCDIGNGTGDQVWLGSTWGTCNLVSCNTNYHPVGNTCVVNSQSCTIANGTGTQSWTGTEWGTCNLVSCDATYHTENNTSCISNTRSCTMPNGTGTESWQNNSWGSCTVASCAATHHANPNNLSCDLNVIACTGDINKATYATKTWSSGSYGACLAQTCANGYQPSGSSCNLICPTGTAYIYSTQNWTTPAGCNTLTVEVYGGGGGGSWHNPNSGGVAGGGGGYARSIIGTSPGSVYYAEVGGGGGAGNYAGANGGGGGTTHFAYSLFAYGGAGGTHAAGWTAGGGATGGNQANHSGGLGGMWVGYGCGGGGGGGAGPGGNGGNGAYGGCPGGGGNGGLAGAGGPGTSNGHGTAYGGGGGGGHYIGPGGAGAPGIIQIIYSFTP